MWVRKPDNEVENVLVQKELKKKSLKLPIIFGMVFGLLFTVLYAVGLRGGFRGFYFFSQNTEFGFKTLLFGTFGFLLFFCLAVYHQRRGSTLFSNNNFVRCVICKELVQAKPENTCQCGGTLEPSEYYDWED
jgi:hypothetical protein